MVKPVLNARCAIISVISNKLTMISNLFPQINFYIPVGQ